MKKLIFLFSLILVIPFYAHDVQVTNTGIYSVSIPHIAICDDSVNLVYGTNLRYYKFESDGPASPLTEGVIPTDNYGPTTTGIAVSKENPKHIVIAYNDYHYDSYSGASFYGCYYSESNDGGKTWTEATLIDTIQQGTTLSNMIYYLPKVEFSGNDNFFILYKVHETASLMNAVYVYTNGTKIRVDDATNNDLEMALNMVVKNNSSGNQLFVSYAKMVNSEANFYLFLPDGSTKLVQNSGNTFLTSESFTKIFVNSDGKILYIYKGFNSGPKLKISDDNGNTWNLAGTVDSHPFQFVAINRISENYFVKLLLDDNNNLSFSVSSDLLNWQEGGKLNSGNAQIESAGDFIDLICNPEEEYIATAWIDNRTGNEEIFYAKSKVPPLTKVKEITQLPSKFELSQNYPNPFSKSSGNSLKTTISFNLARSEFVTLKVFDLLGKEVAVLVQGQKGVGKHQVSFDAGKLSSGIYFYELHAGKFIATRKMMIIN